MRCFSLCLCILLSLFEQQQAQNTTHAMMYHPIWLINMPHDWHDINRTGIMKDVTGDPGNMTALVEFSDYHLVRTDAFTDGEHVDAIEHFFWGKTHGIAMELGSLCGSPNSRSMTYEYEKSMGWRRILIEGDPKYRYVSLTSCHNEINYIQLML